jgi:hypothetical protein
MMEFVIYNTTKSNNNTHCLEYLVQVKCRSIIKLKLEPITRQSRAKKKLEEEISAMQYP